MIAAAAIAALMQANTYAPTTGDFAPEWLRRPSLEEVNAVYPAGARNARLDAEVVLQCIVGADGHLAGCTISREAPVGHGFGQAAVALQRYFAMRPTLPDGRSIVGGVLQIPVRFAYAEVERLGASAAPAAQAGITDEPAVRLVTYPDWIRRPAPALVARYYPKEAARQGVEGKAMVECEVNHRGAPRNCRILEESPSGWGFGEAVLRMTRLVRMRRHPGDPVGNVVIHFPFSFTLPR